MAQTERPTTRARGLARPLTAIRRRNGASPQPEVRASHRREIEYNGLRWIDIHSPTPEEAEALGQEFDFHPLAVDDLVSRVQRPKLDDYDDYLFLVLHYPRFHRQEKVTRASEVDMFLGRDYVITTHSGDLPPLLRFWARLEEDDEARAEYMNHSPEMLLYHIIDRLTNYLFPMMTSIDRNLDDLDERIFRGEPQKAVRQLGEYRRDLITLRRIIRPGMLVISTLENGRASLLNHEEMEQYWGDIADHFARVWEMLTEFKEEIESLDDTFNTLYSYRINETLRALTLISVILLPLTLLSGIYGMNITDLPFAGLPYAFEIVTGFMLTITVSLLLFFKHRGWW